LYWTSYIVPVLPRPATENPADPVPPLTLRSFRNELDADRRLDRYISVLDLRPTYSNRDAYTIVRSGVRTPRYDVLNFEQVTYTTPKGITFSPTIGKRVSHRRVHKRVRKGLQHRNTVSKSNPAPWASKKKATDLLVLLLNAYLVRLCLLCSVLFSAVCSQP
jgi:hypothetical protein